VKVTIEEFCEAVEELYGEWRTYKCEDEGGVKSRLPDFERALKMIKEKAILPNGSEVI